MGAGWKVFWLSAAVFTIAFTAGRVLVPHDVPTSFGLRAVELTAAWIAIMSLSIMTGAWVKERLHRHFGRAPFNPPPTSPSD